MHWKKIAHLLHHAVKRIAGESKQQRKPLFNAFLSIILLKRPPLPLVCSGRGTSWDPETEHCVQDADSEGFIGTYSDGFDDGCVLRSCCEGDCCAEGTTFDAETAFCIPSTTTTSKTTIIPPTPSPTPSPVAVVTPSPTVKPTIVPSTPVPVTPAPVVIPTPAPVSPPTPAPVTPAPLVLPTLAPVTPAPMVLPTLAPVTLAPVVSPTVPPTESRAPVILSAVVNFSEVKGNGLVPFYVDTKKQALAVDARTHKDKFAGAQTVYNGNDGSYTLVVTALAETDGESTYRLFVNGNEIGSVQNPVAEYDYQPINHSWDNVVLKEGDVIQVHFNSASNGKIPEGDGFAYSRGRWTTLTVG